MTSILKVDTIQDTAGNNIINESSDTITIGASGDTITIPSGATLDVNGIDFPTTDGTAGQVLQTNGSGVLSFATPAGGITMSDMWRMTADKSLNSTPSDITANLERVDTTGFSVLGTGMTESSGIFTFPSTGHYLISAFGAGDCSGNNTQWVEFDIMVTLDNSSYAIASQMAASVGQANYYYGVFTTYTLDVTDIANIKVKFRVSAQNSSTSFFGNTTRNRSGFQFIRLGDT